jgi:hypothetical protein
MKEHGNDILRQARILLDVLKGSSEAEATKAADDLLLFCYRLHDRYVILRSRSQRFKGPTFGFLADVIYQLESRPDEALASPEWSGLLQSLLEEIVAGRIVVTERKQSD